MHQNNDNSKVPIMGPQHSAHLTHWSPHLQASNFTHFPQRRITKPAHMNKQQSGEIKAHSDTCRRGKIKSAPRLSAPPCFLLLLSLIHTHSIKPLCEEVCVCVCEVPPCMCSSCSHLSSPHPPCRWPPWRCRSAHNSSHQAHSSSPLPGTAAHATTTHHKKERKLIK